MSAYLDYLKTQLPNNWKYVDEQELNWDGETTTLILKNQTGTVYHDTKVIPFQIVVLSKAPILDKGILEAFCQLKTNTYFTLGLNVAKQNFFTPIIPTVASPTGNTLTSQVILTGTIIESFGVSDISKIEIDSVEYETSERKLILVSQVDTTGRISDTKLKQKGNVLNSQVQLQFNLINKNNTFCNAIRNIRNGTTAPTSTFSVKVTYTDNNAYDTFTMIVTSATLISDNANMPVLTITMMEGN